jgi:integrase
VLDRYVAHKKAQREAKARAKVDLTHPEGTASEDARALAMKLALKLAADRHKTLVSALKPIRAHFGALPPAQATAESPAAGISAEYVRQYVAARMASPRQRGNRTKDADAPSTVDRAGTVGDRTVSIELAYLRAALKRAADEGEIEKKTLPTIKLPRGLARARKRTLKRTEFRTFMAELFAPKTPRHLRVLVMLGILTSQRSKTLKAGRWPLVDYDEGFIRWTETDPDVADNKRIQDTPLTPDMARWLMEVQADALSEYIVEWNGRPVGSVKTAWRALLKRAGLKDVRIHDLRRSAATIALNAGGDIKRIALLLNDDEATVRRNYAHASPDLLLGVVRIIEAQVDQARAPQLEVPPAE